MATRRAAKKSDAKTAEIVKKEDVVNAKVVTEAAAFIKRTLAEKFAAGMLAIGERLSLPRFRGHRVYAASASDRQSDSVVFGLR